MKPRVTFCFSYYLWHQLSVFNVTFATTSIKGTMKDLKKKQKHLIEHYDSKIQNLDEKEKPKYLTKIG